MNGAVRVLQRGVTLAALAAATAWLPAQGAGAPDAAHELQRSQRDLQQSRRDGERLLDLRLRHDLGLPIDVGDRAFRAGPAPTTESVERMQQQLRDEQAATTALAERFERLRADAELLRLEAAAHVLTSPDTTAVTVPPANTTVTRATTGATAPLPAPAAPAPAPALETQRPERATAPLALELDLDPPRAQIHGSTDHRRVALALLRAGQALLDRGVTAREQGQEPLAAQLDARGAERLRRALDELAPLLAADEPSLEALFCQGKCLEALFRHAERYDGLTLSASARDYQRREQEVRDPWLRITARDVRRDGARGETEVLGPWGLAAQAALEHFRWMNLHAGYDARATIDALTWPGATER